MPRILVTGATGSTGYPVVKELIAKGFPVRAMVRKKDARSAALDKMGAETVVSDMYDPDQLFQAAKGTQRAYYLPLIEPFMIQSAIAFAVAAREAKLEHVVQMSQWTSHRAHPTAMTQQTWLVDKLFAQIPGVAHTIFNPGMFAHNFPSNDRFRGAVGHLSDAFGRRPRGACVKRRYGSDGRCTARRRARQTCGQPLSANGTSIAEC